MSAEQKRELIEEFSAGRLTVEDLAEAMPECACEGAAPVEGSPGPVSDDETLRFFLTSRSDVDGKRESQLKKRPFKAAALKKAYTVGLSVSRLEHASREELEYTAGLLHGIQVEKSGEYGGVVGVVDFTAKAVRQGSEPSVPMCVLETPLDKNLEGGLSRPSHADVVNSKAGMTEEEKKSSREIIYNAICQIAAKVRSEDVADCNLLEFLPGILKA